MKRSKAQRRRRAVRRSAARAARRAARSRRSQRGTLAALTVSALALPGLADDARAESPTGTWSLEHASSYYVEDELDDSDVSIGNETERYEIQAHQFLLKAPFTPRSDVELDVLHERMSGATPWFVAPGPGGDPVQVMSGASVEERRTDVLGKINYYLDNGKASLLGGISTENDYFSGNGGFQARIDFNENNTSFDTGFGFSFDHLEPTDADLFATRPDEEDKQSYSTFASLSQVLTPSTIAQVGVSYEHARGYLSDPYKLVSVGGVNLGDSRPESRNRLAAMTRLRQHVSPLKGTLHADYAFYTDDWGIDAHTVRLAWYQSLWDSVRLIPEVRYYAQSQADFYDLVFTTLPADGFASSDYRLAPFGSLSYLIKAEADLPVSWPMRIEWKGSISWERYQASGDLALSNVEIENPGLTSYNVFRVNLRARF